MKLFKKTPRYLLLVLLFLINSSVTFSKINPAKYRLPPFSDSINLSIKASYQNSIDSVYKRHLQLNNAEVINAIAHHRSFTDRTFDFYILLSLIVLLSLIRVLDPKYFQILWQAFRNPTQGSRQLKDKLQTATLSNLLMNIFFVLTAGFYLYFAIENFTPHRSGDVKPYLLLLLLIGGVLIIYLAKYIIVRFSGWAFRVDSITEQYNFNVFLVNKIVSLALLPFIIVIAFSSPAFAQLAMVISLILIVLMFANRYMRSWQVFGSFFQYSKFHFFTYLCASELLPLAVLMKLLVRGLLINQ